MKIFNLSILFCCLLTTHLMAQKGEEVKINIKADQAGVKIDKNIYGHFAEHLGRCIYGGFYVGEDSKIPNTAGVRNDVVEALKELKIPNLRWPGGCFADTYHWQDGIGPKGERPTIVNKWWGGVTEDNSFGTHDFLNMCELLDTEPYLSANVGSGTVQEVADWAQYVTHDGVSPMTKLRLENGREKPWEVKFWGIGNEAWGCGGNMTPEYYADVYRRYVTFMPGGLFRIASGASSGDYNWTEVLMKNIPNNMIEGMALHHYSVIDWSNKGPASTFSEEHYFKIMKEALKMEELVEKHSEIMDKYDPENKIALVVDEWGGWYDVEPGTNPGFLYQQNTMRDAMIAGTTLNVFNNHAKRVKMANLAQAINVLQAVILTDEEKMILTPTYWVMKMYNVHQDADLLPIEMNQKYYAFGEDKLPAISASASKDGEGNIHISVVNIDAHKANDVTFNLEGVNLKNVTAQILTSDQLQDHNTFEQPEKIKPAEFKKFKSKKGEITMSLPPFSVVVFEIK
ncbi:alpha-N-arabinofuranosidase [Fulvivirga sediminis]|uniref:non-reducing end alpha-L-arabinofuranosidase n=1 Tax=Fulvivirga sediminis TaxID=2803949 RepID=A0A937JYF0_9BACT|nr:alpha-L-arabinofuranosidase C-terminal domain-containing protein [Fulvivirga sediminis]MBL3656363.1 alpha-N-arabinofuranosidase [Fulvivirga sediminis]